MRLLHGTTLARAEGIVQRGPDLRYVEPGGIGIASNFTFTAEGTPSALGASAAYASGKAAGFPNERGAAILVVDVPDDIVRAAAVEHLELFAGIVEYEETADVVELVGLCGGVVQFDPGDALNQLMSVWATLAKEIRGVP